ncbi:hypothetical protein [Vibrio tetraodonis]|uniref:hypothetical protein n=1 Tax=Vibrio tetraodonis TaxID=2231647 RepID=UPI000E0B5970|nr:hypothetical protein [Vibrio tetraodonis]
MRSNAINQYNTNGSLFVQEKWINLQTNDTDLTRVQAACQAHGSNYHVPTTGQINSFKREFWRAQYDTAYHDQLRQFFMDTLLAEQVGYSSHNKFATPYFLSRSGTLPYKTSIELHYRVARVNSTPLEYIPQEYPFTFTPDSSALDIINDINRRSHEYGKEKWEKSNGN